MFVGVGVRVGPTEPLQKASIRPFVIRSTSRSTSALASDSLPYSNVISVRAARRVCSAHLEGEGVPVQLKKSNLISTSPDLACS